MTVSLEYEQIERRVVDTFPYPIAVNLAYARRARLADASERELHHLLATYEALIHLLGSIYVLDLVSARSTTDSATKLEQVLAPVDKFVPNPDGPSIGDWIHFIDKCMPSIEVPFLKETTGWSESDRTELISYLHDVRRVRNRYSHPHPRPSEVVAQQVLHGLRPVFLEILRRLDFLGSYTMLAVGGRTASQAFVTRLRGFAAPLESQWLDLTNSLEHEDVVLVDPKLEECLRLYPFYLASEAQDDADRIWAFFRSSRTGKTGYHVVDRASSGTIVLRRRVERPSVRLRRAAEDPEHSPRIPLQASDSAKEELGASTRPPPALGHVVGVEELKRLPGSMSLVFEGRISGQPPLGKPVGTASPSLPPEGTRVIVKAARQGHVVPDNGCLQSEFDLLSSISSPYVPKAYGLFDDDEGRHHLLVEHREGDRLSTRLRSSRMDDEEPAHDGHDAAAIAEQLVSALADAHHHGSHGDLKPGNILVSSRGRVSLIDFGAGRIDEELGTEMIPAFGTRGYVAPELFLPTDDEPDRKRSDLYSLGVVVYQLFAGRLPKLDAKREGLDVSDMPGPRVWRLIVRWCGHVDPEKRPASVDALVEFLRGRARAPSDVNNSVPYRTRLARYWNAMDVLVITLAIIVALITAGEEENALYLTFPIAGLIYLITSALREHWQDAMKDGLDTSGARRHVAGVAGWWVVKLAAILLGIFVLIWFVANVVGPILEFVLDLFIWMGSTLLSTLTGPPWLKNTLIVAVSLAGLAAAVLLHKRSERAE